MKRLISILFIVLSFSMFSSTGHGTIAGKKVTVIVDWDNPIKTGDWNDERDSPEVYYKGKYKYNDIGTWIPLKWDDGDDITGFTDPFGKYSKPYEDKMGKYIRAKDGKVFPAIIEFKE